SGTGAHPERPAPRGSRWLTMGWRRTRCGDGERPVEPGGGGGLFRPLRDRNHQRSAGHGLSHRVQPSPRLDHDDPREGWAARPRGHAQRAVPDHRALRDRRPDVYARPLSWILTVTLASVAAVP